MSSLMTYEQYRELIEILKTLPSSKEKSGYDYLLATHLEISYLYNEEKMMLQIGYILPSFRKVDFSHMDYQPYIDLTDGSIFIPHNLEGPSFYSFEAHGTKGAHRVRRCTYSIDGISVLDDNGIHSECQADFLKQLKVINDHKKKNLKKKIQNL